MTHQEKPLPPRRRLAAVLSCLAFAGCHQSHDPGNHAPAAVTHQKPSWESYSSTDSMTDVTTYSTTAKAIGGEGSLTISCDMHYEHVFIDSDMFLANGQSLPLMMRFGRDSPSTYKVWGHDHLAVIESKLKLIKPGDVPTSEDIDSFDNYVAIVLLRRAKAPIRIRLQSFDGETRDLEFPVAGMREAMRAVEQHCGIDKDGNYSPPRS